MCETFIGQLNWLFSFTSIKSVFKQNEYKVLISCSSIRTSCSRRARIFAYFNETFFNETVYSSCELLKYIILLVLYLRYHFRDHPRVISLVQGIGKARLVQCFFSLKKISFYIIYFFSFFIRFILVNKRKKNKRAREYWKGAYWVGQIKFSIFFTHIFFVLWLNSRDLLLWIC